MSNNLNMNKSGTLYRIVYEQGGRTVIDGPWSTLAGTLDNVIRLRRLVTVDSQGRQVENLRVETARWEPTDVTALLG